MKRSTLIICLVLFTINNFAQEVFKPGKYVFSTDAFTPKNSKTIRIENNKLQPLHYAKEQKQFFTLNDYYQTKPNFQYVESSSINRNNAHYTWINTHKNAVWTETQSLHLSNINNPYIYKSFWFRMVNNNEGEKCFENKKCFTLNKEGFTRLYPLIYIEKEKIQVGAQSNPDIQIEEFRITDKTTEITLKFTNFSGGFLHDSNNENEFYLSTNKSEKKYKLLNQYNWNGTLEKGFGYKEKTDEPFKIILFFEKMEITDFTSISINLKEGNCKDGCWNFYDITFK